MNKTAIKNFAIWARKKLISDITYQAGMLGVTEKGIAKPLPQSTLDLQFYDIGTKNYAEVSGVQIRQREKLVTAIHAKERGSDYKTAFRYVMEEVAYTWFNRLIAVRFMEVNDYLPSHVRVLSSESAGKAEPDIVTNPFDTDLTFSEKETAEIYALKENGDEKSSNALFRMLFIKQCNKLHEILPRLFEETADYSELLLTISFTDKDGVLWHLVNDIPESDFDVSKEGQVEIIGWMYQYYNTEPKDEVFAELKKNIKISKEKIPAATQLFTPDWIVRYMVENSLGRLWVEGHPNDELKAGWKYYLEEAKQEPQVQEQLAVIRAEYKKLNPEDIKLIDPCMGSGHILVYAFDVLMQIYEACGYTQRDAAQSIVANNIYGLDIDDRAAQLAYFAVMMKARQYDRRFFTRGIAPHVLSIEGSDDIDHNQVKLLGKGMSPIERSNAQTQMNALLAHLLEAKEYGSIIDVPGLDWALLRRYAASGEESAQVSLASSGIEQTQEKLLRLIDVGEVMARKYDVVVTNPPYMGASGMGPRLNQFVKDNYPDSKSDLFAVFIERCNEMTKTNGLQAMITQHAWMFLSSYEKLRAKLLKVDTVNMAHLGARAFEEIGGEVVQTTSFVLRNCEMKLYKGTYFRLIEPTTQQGKEDMFLAKENRYIAQQDNFSKIPGAPVAYWVKEKFINRFQNNRIEAIADARSGMTTTDNTRFLRAWFEVSFGNIGFNYSSINETADKAYKWFPFCKGGDFRRWYGNYEYVVNWFNNGQEIRKAAEGASGGRLVNIEFAMLECLTWTKISSGNISFRYKPKGYFFSDAAPGILIKVQKYASVLFALLNTKPAQYSIDLINPTLNYVPGAVASVPFEYVQKEIQVINMSVAGNVDISKVDWDSFETSWDFSRHPLVTLADPRPLDEMQWGKINRNLSDCYREWERECDERFAKLKANEEELNRIFIDIYGLQDELTPEVEDKDVTVRKADLGRDIRSLISYAVGCMFGRYSLDVPGLAYAGGDWDGSKYKTFMPDMDNCIPITDETYFEDDVVGRFVEFIRTVYGSATLEENLSFIAKALGNKGATSREVIRNYFLNDFMKDHLKVYQKRPIYWLFDSGKQNGFKALVYMHHWNADTVGNLRVEYLHRMQRVYEREIERMQDTIENSKVSREVAAAQKRKEKLTKQLKETKDYDAKIAHIALSRIDIDLDDGVKVNYEKVQTASDGEKVQILAKI